MINAIPNLAKNKEDSKETSSLNKKSSTICKICHSGGSCEQLIQPCLCKGNLISYLFITEKKIHLFTTRYGTLIKYFYPGSH